MPPTRTAPRANGKLTVFETHIDLKPDVRQGMVALLNQQVADTFDLFSQTKQAHWNVRGPDFYQLHELFDELAAALAKHVDELAERATALGGLVKGTVRMAGAATRLPELPLQFAGSMQIVGAMVERYATLAASTRKAISVAEEADDQGTMDLLTEISRDLDKSLWFLEAHLQAQA